MTTFQKHGPLGSWTSADLDEQDILDIYDALLCLVQYKALDHAFVRVRAKQILNRFYRDQKSIRKGHHYNRIGRWIFTLDDLRIIERAFQVAGDTPAIRKAIREVLK